MTRNRYRLWSKVTAAMLSLTAVITSGCQNGLGSMIGGTDHYTQQEFDEFIEMMPSMMLSGDSMSVYYYYDDPESVGIELYPTVLSYSTKKDWELGEKASADFLKMLNRIDETDLNENSVLMKKSIIDYFERVSAMDPYFYLSNNYLGSTLGMQASLPLMLSEYPIKNEYQVESYLHLLSTVPEAFDFYFENEKDRQANGYGLSQDVLDAVIEQCENFVNKDHSFLYDVIDEKIDAIDDMDMVSKKRAKNRNKQYVDDYIIAAYEKLGKNLTTISASDQTHGLAGYTDGDKYYEALLKFQTGTNMTPEEAEKLLQNRYNIVVSRYTQIIAELAYSPDELDAAYEAFYEAYSDPDQIIAFATEQSKKLYPDIGTVAYRIEQVPEAMRENFSPAAFITPTLDKPVSDPDKIYLNTPDNRRFFQTMVHEGITGHMYQANFLKRAGVPDICYIMSNQGYSEGWATYTELHSYELFDDPQTRMLVEMDNLDAELSLIIYGLADIGIHYHGWSQAEFSAFIHDYYSIDDEEAVKSMYIYLVETPANYLSYILSAEVFAELREATESKLGDDFSLVEFHAVVLSTGSTGFPIVQEQIRNYLEDKQTEQNKAA